MNILEAIKSGRAYKRHGDTVFLCNKYQKYYLTHEELIAEDYEIEPEKKIEITLAQLDVAFRNAIHSGNSGVGVFKLLAKELGFNE